MLDTLNHSAQAGAGGEPRYIPHPGSQSKSSGSALTLVRRRPFRGISRINPTPCTRAEATLNLLSGRWTLQVLWATRDGRVRLGQLSRLLPGASRKMLTESLRKLEKAGLVLRQDLTERVPHVEYYLNPSMRSEVHQLLDQLACWGELYETERFPLAKSPVCKAS